MGGTDQEKMSTDELLRVQGLFFSIAHLSSLLKAYLIKNLLVSFTGNCSTNNGFSCIIRSPVRGSKPCCTKANKALI